jgi:hypothetical protein
VVTGRLWPAGGNPSPLAPRGIRIGRKRSSICQFFDRQEATVDIANTNEDDFVRNLCTLLGEERVALAVRRPDAFVAGSFP